MPAGHRDNPVTRETVHRVYQFPEALRVAVGDRRRALGQTMRGFVAEAVAGELPGLVARLRQALPELGGPARPARLPLSETLLAQLRQAGAAVGLPASRLLLCCLARAAARKRRRRGTDADGARGGRVRRRGAPPGAAPAPAAETKEGAAPGESSHPAGEGGQSDPDLPSRPPSRPARIDSPGEPGRGFTPGNPPPQAGTARPRPLTRPPLREEP
jgi:hypothetical protein